MDRERIGKYQILGKIGQGTMGEVFKALDPALNREVALKTVSVLVAPDEESIQRFQREAQAAALLNHPNIVTVHDYGQEDGILFMAMELLKGPDLRDAIDEDRLGTLEQKLNIMDGLLNALEYAHARGVVHRDIKPANIHLGSGQSGRQVKIMDFGLARVNTSEMTQDGIVLGTPNYMSPEQALGDKVDGRSDLFSSGAVLYELLTSHKPFEADSTPSVLFQVVHRQPPQVKRWAPHVPTPLVEVVNRALTKDRDKRYASAAEMRAALGSARQASRSVPDLRPPPLPPDQSTISRRPPSRPGGSHPPSRRRGPGSTASLRGRKAARPRSSTLPALAVGASFALIALLFLAGPWILERIWPRTEGGAQVGQLTRALVATQVQLAQRELSDKNWQAAVTQAESALRLDPSHDEGTRILETAQGRLEELSAAIAAARRDLGAEDTEAASEQLSRILEIDPRHPAATELSAHLNTVFRTQADTAAASTRAAREGAVAGGARGSQEFKEADAAAARAEELVASREYADATRTLLDARDSYDRAGRAARERQAAAAGATVTPTAAPSSPRTRPDQVVRAPTRSPRAATPPPVRSLPAAAPRTTADPDTAPTPAPPARRFVSGETRVTTPAAGALAGFESADVTTRRPPRFLGRMEFEVLPTEVRPGEPFVVRVHLVNDGQRPVQVDGIEITTVEDGQRSSTPARVLQGQVRPGGRALVAQHSAVWSPAASWSLIAVAAVEGDERVRNRLVAE